MSLRLLRDAAAGCVLAAGVVVATAGVSSAQLVAAMPGADASVKDQIAQASTDQIIYGPHDQIEVGFGPEESGVTSYLSVAVSGVARL